jgi:hypothetical protein
MVQVLQPREKGPSFAQKVASGLVQGGMQEYDKYQALKQQNQQMQRENESAKKLGIDLSGITDPQTRQKLLIESLKGQQKNQLMGQKQDFLGKLFNNGPQENQQSPDQGMQTGNQGFDPSNVSDEDIARATAMDPTLGRELRAAKNAAQKKKIADRNFEYQKTLNSPEHKREQTIEASQAQADVAYNKNLQETSKQHELKHQTLNNLEKLNAKGVTGKPYEKLLEKFGLVNLTSEGRREFAADVKHLITDIRSILGGQFSNFEFQTILNAYPSADFSQEANAAIIRNLKEFQDIKTKEVEFATQIKKENGGKVPYDFQSIVNEKVRDYANSKMATIKQNTKEIMDAEYGVPKGHTLMFDPNGEPMSVPDNEVEALLKQGAMVP